MEAVESVVERMVKGGRIKCPQCGDTRKKNTQKTMGVTINKEGTLYNCFHCGISGKIPLKKPYIKPVSMPVSKPKKRVNTPENNEYFYNFLKKRGISKKKPSKLLYRKYSECT